MVLLTEAEMEMETAEMRSSQSQTVNYSDNEFGNFKGYRNMR